MNKLLSRCTTIAQEDGMLFLMIFKVIGQKILLKTLQWTSNPPQYGQIQKYDCESPVALSFTLVAENVAKVYG